MERSSMLPRAREQGDRRCAPGLMVTTHDRVAALLIGRTARAGGGLPSRRTPGLYEFPSEASRDASLRAIRQAHGWTSVEPTGRRP